jgi:outer membrane biosynthesis protein TonB
MGVDRTGKITLRIGRTEVNRVVAALVLSVLVHALLWGGLAVSRHFKLSLRIPWPAWLQRVVTPSPPPPPPATREPYLFVDVREYQSVPNPPKDATRYSDRNAIAANPDVNKDQNEPRIEGEKNEQQNLEDANRRNKFDQLMPDPPKPEPAPEPDAAPKIAPGPMTVAKADLQPPPERKRPRTIREAMLQKNQMPGRKSEQAGGAMQRANASFNVKATGFGAYDRMLIDAISDRWYNLLDNLSYDNYQQGKVVVQFTLSYRGDITDVRVAQNTVSDMLSLMCEKAVRDPAPFGEWSREMRLAVGEDSRRITFTFFYN